MVVKGAEAGCEVLMVELLAALYARGEGTGCAFGEGCGFEIWVLLVVVHWLLLVGGLMVVVWKIGSGIEVGKQGRLPSPPA